MTMSLRTGPSLVGSSTGLTVGPRCLVVLEGKAYQIVETPEEKSEK